MGAFGIRASRLDVDRLLRACRRSWSVLVNDIDPLIDRVIYANAHKLPSAALTLAFWRVTGSTENDQSSTQVFVLVVLDANLIGSSR